MAWAGVSAQHQGTRHANKQSSDARGEAWAAYLSISVFLPIMTLFVTV